MLPTGRKNDESAQKALAALKTARRDTDQAFNALRLILNAMALTAGNDAYTYEELIRQIQQTIKYYRQINDERRRTNRRVALIRARSFLACFASAITSLAFSCSSSSWAMFACKSSPCAIMLR